MSEVSLRRKVVLKQRRWDILHSFELRHKKIFLKKLTTNKSLGIFKNLYLFAKKINKTDYKQLEAGNTGTLAEVHSIFMKVTI